MPLGLKQLCTTLLAALAGMNKRQREGGGFKQRLVATGFPLAKAKSSASTKKKEKEKPKSMLAVQLLQSWAWGRMSLPSLQKLAQAAVDDGLEDLSLRCECFKTCGWVV